MEQTAEIQRQIAFHLTGVGGDLEPVDSTMRPALLAPYRDLTALRYDYPVVLVDDASDEAMRTLADRARRRHAPGRRPAWRRGGTGAPGRPSRRARDPQARRRGRRRGAVGSLDASSARPCRRRRWLERRRRGRRLRSRASAARRRPRLAQRPAPEGAALPRRRGPACAGAIRHPPCRLHPLRTRAPA